MKSFTKLLCLICLFAASKSLAYVPEEGKVTATFGPFLYKTDFRNARPDIQSPWMNGMALIAQGNVNNTGSLEIAMMYFNKIFFRERSGLLLVEKTPMVYMTMGYRWWLKPWLSVAPTFFSSYTMGSIDQIRNDFPPDSDIDSSARDITEYGIDLSVQWELWSDKKKWDLLLDTRYSYSPTNKSQEDANHYGALLGFRYLVQEK